MKKVSFSTILVLFISLNIFPQDSTFQFSFTMHNGFNFVSIPGLLPVPSGWTQRPDLWWIDWSWGGLWRFQNGYVSCSEMHPGFGYWVKHDGTRTYNTGDEWPASGILIAPHEPVPALVGWNMIGVYECPVSINEITTTPPGLIVGQYYKFDGSYSIADTLYPGFAYWVKVNANCSINIPPCNEPEINNIESGERPQFRP